MKTSVSFVALACAPLVCFNSVPHRAIIGGAPVAAEAVALDDETIVGTAHYSQGFPARNANASVNAVVEIPAGTTAKFEVDEATGMLRWQKKREDGSRRAIDYLPYPVNYGMVLTRDRKTAIRSTCSCLAAASSVVTSRRRGSSA